MAKVWKPTKAQLLAAHGKRIRDCIAADLAVLFCGINPGLYSGAVGHHFARPGNRFWPALHSAGFTPRLLSPFEERELLDYGCGVTNIVARATATAAELTDEEMRAGLPRLKSKVRRFQPRVLAVLGISAFRTAFAQPEAQLGRQTETIGNTILWVLPNPSGLNAHYQAADLAKLFREVKQATDLNP
jgi:TDG/mug DNA glycosylase family protein